MGPCWIPVCQSMLAITSAACIGAHAIFFRTSLHHVFTCAMAMSPVLNGFLLAAIER